jgi:hypothetical protein
MIDEKFNNFDKSICNLFRVTTNTDAENEAAIEAALAAWDLYLATGIYKYKFHYFAFIKKVR